jgi:hypothetical protein
LLDLYQKQTQEKPTGVRSYYAKLFQILCQEINPHCQVPIVLSISGGDHYDTWETVYNSTRSLFSTIIVTTSYERYVETARTAMPETVAVIRAGDLNLASAKVFLSQRMADERLPGGAPPPIGPLTPFSDAALDELFREAKPGAPVKLRIHYVKRVLRQALESHIATLHELVAQNGPEELHRRPAADLLIQPQQIRDSGDKVNRGIR